MSALANAAKVGTLDQVRKLLDAGRDPNRSDGLKRPLHYAVVRGDPEIVKLLLERGANPNTPYGSGSLTALHALALPRAASPKTIGPLARLLLAHGADVNGRSFNRWTPIQTAVVQMSYAETPELLDALTSYVRLLWKHGGILPPFQAGEGMFTVGGRNTDHIQSLLESLPRTRQAAQGLATIASETKLPPEINAEILSFLKPARGPLSPEERADKLEAHRRMTQSQRAATEARQAREEEQTAEVLAAMKTGGRRRRKTLRRRK